MKCNLKKSEKFWGKNTKLKNKRPKKSKSEDLWSDSCGARRPICLPRARNNAGRLGSVFISVCLETRWLGQKSGFYVPERPCNGKFPLGEPRDVVGEKNSKTSWRFDGYKGILA